MNALLTFVELSEDHLSFAKELLYQELPKHIASLEEVAEDPALCYTHFLGNKSGDPRKKEEAEKWASDSKVDIDVLYYFVALDEHKDPIGVSGFYSVIPGYLAKQGNNNTEIVAQLEQRNHFWMGWTAVHSDHKGLGIGTQLMRHAVMLSLEFAVKNKIPDPQWTVLADSGAASFYRKRGLTFKIAHQTESIFSDDLHYVAGLLRPDGEDLTDRDWEKWKTLLGWKHAPTEAKVWWDSLKGKERTLPVGLNDLCKMLAQSGYTIHHCYDACIDSGTNYAPALLSYIDYLIKKEEGSKLLKIISQRDNS